MPTDKKNYAEQLPLPRTEPDATEILRLWTTPDVVTTCVTRPFPFPSEQRAPDPRTWGIVLADAAIQVIDAYDQNVEAPRQEVLERIREAFNDTLDGKTDRNHFSRRQGVAEPE